MPLFDSTTLNRFFLQGEQIVSSERPFLVDRYSPPIFSNVKVYELPDYVISIRRVTYRGIKLDPLPQRNFREVFQSATSQGTPFWYVFNNVGQNKIQLFPAPGENLLSAENLWDNDIPTSCIVEFYRAADGVNFKLPVWIRRQLLKNYVALKCYSVEGQGQNLKLSAYYGTKWDTWKTQWYTLLDELYNKPRKLITDEITLNTYFPGTPMLPISRFGISADADY